MTQFKDLTLREGSQVPGFQISTDAGKRVIDELVSLDVDVVEISFPRASSREEWYRYADDLDIRTVALARAVPGDIDAALQVGPDEIEIMINSSDKQLEYALGKSRFEAKELLLTAVDRAIDGGVDVGITLMDAIRAENDFLAEVAKDGVDAGANHVTLADTTGYGTPSTVGETVDSVVDVVESDIPISIHAHDDLGVATANAAAGVQAGAQIVDATVGGIGERAGNAPLEEVAVLLAENEVPIDLILTELVPSIKKIHNILDLTIPPAKPIIGERAYRHESGMHTAAMLQDPSTYEPFTPAEYGGERTLLFGSDTGRGAVK
ncbi:MAG: LeuA family protein, partial [Halobacteriaceae archaeon]